MRNGVGKYFIEKPKINAWYDLKANKATSSNDLDEETT